MSHRRPPSGYWCPTHGCVTAPRSVSKGTMEERTLSIGITVGPEEKQGLYCLLCYVDWIHAHLPRLVLQGVREVGQALEEEQEAERQKALH